MSLLSRMKRALKSKANAAVDRATSPEKQLDAIIAELEQQERDARKELISYKATAAQMKRDIEKLDGQVTTWERRAVHAVKVGDDELAKKCLGEKRRAEAERDAIRRDRDETAGYALELNRTRKQVETRLRMLKLKKGTMAAQIATARSGGDSPLAAGRLWDKLDRVEGHIERKEIEAEARASLELADGDARAADHELGKAAAESDADAALSELKAKMAEDRREKKLTMAEDRREKKLPK